MKDVTFNPKWLLLLGVAGVSLVAFDGIFPGSGVAIAGAIALWWAIDTGAVKYVSGGLTSLRKAAAL